MSTGNDHTTDDGKETKSSSSQSSRSPERRTNSDHESNKEQEEEDASQQWQMDTSDFPSPKRLVLVMIGLFLALFAANLDTTILATAIPYITTEFRTIRDVSWYAAAIMLVSAALQSTWGKIFRYFPIKIMFLFSILIFEVGSLICALAPTSTALVIGRAITGLGASGMTAGVFTLIAFSAPPKHVPAYMGLGGATYALASLAGPLLGGAFTENVTWRWCFWINLPIGAVTVGVMILVYRTPKAAQPQQATWRERILQMDLVGTFLIMAAVVCFILAFQWGGSVKPWSDSTVIGTIVGFVVISAVFIANEVWMQERAVLVPRLMKMRRIWANNAHVFCVSGGFFILIYYISIFFQSVQGRTPIQSGVRSLPINIGCFLSIASGMIVTAYGRLWAPLMTGGAILATIGAGLIYTWDLNTSIGEYIGYQVLTGIGTGITLQIPLMANQAAVTPMEISTISAVTIFFQIIGGAFSLAAAQAAFASTLVSKVTQYAPGIDAANLLNVGASDLDLVYQGAELDAVLRAYMDGIKVTFALATALLGASVLLALVPKWGELRPQQATTKTKDGKPNSSEDAV